MRKSWVSNDRSILYNVFCYSLYLDRLWLVYSGGSRKSVRGRRFVEGGDGYGQKNNSRSLFDSVKVFFSYFCWEKIGKKNWEGAAVAGSPNSWIRQCLFNWCFLSMNSSNFKRVYQTEINKYDWLQKKHLFHYNWLLLSEDKYSILLQ
jgi:hypothetical protein